MEGKLVFCKDSILRFCSSHEQNFYIPLNLIEDSESEFKTLLTYLRKVVIIEEGTTFGSIIVSLEPWKNAIKDLLDVNVEAYITETKNVSKMYSEFEWINISKKTEISRIHRTDSENTRLKKNLFEIKSDFDICAYKYNDNNDFSIATDIHRLKNVPTVFTKKHYVVGFKNQLEKDIFLNKETSGFFEKENHYFIKDEETEITLYDLLETIFKKGLVYPAPIDQDIIFGKLNDLLENESYINNIEEDVNNNNKVLEQEIEFEDKKLKEWKQIKNKVKIEDSVYIIKNSIKEATAKEERLYNYNLTKK